MKNKQSTIDLHNIHEDIYLGFLSEDIYKPQIGNFQASFFGGEPIWLHQPKQHQQMCSQCKTPLSFLGQIYSPFESEHCFHRILYFLTCEKCLRQFRCIRQQQRQNYKLNAQIKSKVKKICDARELQNDNHSRNQFIKLMNRLKIQIQEEKVIEEAESDQQDQKQIKNQIINQVGVVTQQFQKLEQIQQKKQEKKKQQKKQEQIDVIFQVYKKSIVQLGNPCLLYTDVALPYNNRPLNPQHFCTQCGAKLKLEVQLTQRILNMSNDPNSKLLLMDWGALMVYTCSSSCQQSQQQCVVVQYQIDAVTDEDIKKLKKNKKNRKKKQKKSNSKSKQNKVETIKQEDKHSSNESEQEAEVNIKQAQTKQNKQQNGDWD